MRRFTRLTNGFSKKVENLEAAVALHFVYYNWCRPHQSLKGLTPAQRIGIADGRWSIEKLVGLLDRPVAVTLGDELDAGDFVEAETPRTRRQLPDSN